jgi:hypothetical protein
MTEASVTDTILCTVHPYVVFNNKQKAPLGAFHSYLNCVG